MLRLPILVFLATLVVASSLPAENVGEDTGEDTAAVAVAADEALLAADAAHQRAAGSRDREAFLATLGADAKLFADTLREGPEAFVQAMGPLWTGKYDFHYDGTPLEATVAESGELGFTLGEVETRFQRPGLSRVESIRGHYLNVWSRDGEEGWKLVASTSLVVHPRLGAARDPRSGLMTAWPELKGRIGAEIEIRWMPETVVRAESADLAYTLGRYRASFEDTGSSHSGSGHFLAVWRRDDADHWQLVAEGFTPPGIFAGDEEDGAADSHD